MEPLPAPARAGNRPPEAAAVAASSDKGARDELASARMFAPTGAELEQRKAMLAKVHMAKNDLMRLPGFDEDAYRAILEEFFGVSSSADLKNRQLHDLLRHFASLGWQAKKGRHRRTAPAALTNDLTGMSREGLMAKIEAMLAEKGRAEGTDVPWAYAVAILKRQTANNPAGQARCLDKADAGELRDVIAALYRDAKRKGRRVR